MGKKRRQGIGKKPHVQKYGDWQKVRDMVARFPRQAEKINHQSLMQVGLLGERLAVKHIQNQDLDWQPLSPAYLQRKIKQGHSEKILVKTSTYMQSITSKVDGRVAYSGVFRKQRTPDGRSLVNVAKVMEFGSKARNIPARPLWKPVLKQVERWVKKNKFFAKRLHDGILKLNK